MDEKHEHEWVMEARNAGTRLKPDWYARVICADPKCAGWLNEKQVEARLNQHATLQAEKERLLRLLLDALRESEAQAYLRPGTIRDMYDVLENAGL